MIDRDSNFSICHQAGLVAHKIENHWSKAMKKTDEWVSMTSHSLWIDEGKR